MSISASRCASGAFSLVLSDVCLFVWSYSGLFVCLFFILSYCCSLDCWFTTNRKDVDLDGREIGEDLEDGGRKTIIRICQIKKNLFSRK